MIPLFGDTLVGLFFITGSRACLGGQIWKSVLSSWWRSVQFSSKHKESSSFLLGHCISLPWVVTSLTHYIGMQSWCWQFLWSKAVSNTGWLLGYNNGLLTVLWSKNICPGLRRSATLQTLQLPHAKFLSHFHYSRLYTVLDPCLGTSKLSRGADVTTLNWR